jgi:hypothetical protein
MNTNEKAAVLVRDREIEAPQKGDTTWGFDW